MSRERNQQEFAHKSKGSRANWRAGEQFPHPWRKIPFPAIATETGKNRGLRRLRMSPACSCATQNFGRTSVREDPPKPSMRIVRGGNQLARFASGLLFVRDTWRPLFHTRFGGFPRCFGAISSRFPGSGGSGCSLVFPLKSPRPSSTTRDDAPISPMAFIHLKRL
jgi:hypothetical protein